MNWNDAAAIAQVVTTAVTAVGVSVALYVGTRAAREAAALRLQAVRPHLSFPPGARKIPCELRNSSAIRGINPRAALEYTHSRENENNCITPTTLWGGLINYGNGAALDAVITFLPVRVYVGDSDYPIEPEKRSAFPYSASFNHIPSAPSHILPGEEGLFFRLPTPVVVDYNGKIDRLDCLIKIEYRDIYGNGYKSYQGVRVWINRSVPSVTMTFIEEKQIDEDYIPTTID